MNINNINPINKIARNCNLYEAKINSLQDGNTSFKALLDTQRNTYISDKFNNYNKNGLVSAVRQDVSDKFSMKNIFTEIDSEFPNCREFTTYRDKVNGDGRMLLDVRIENCPKGTVIDEKEFEEAMSKVILVADKSQYAFDRIGYRADDLFGVQLEYNKTTGKIEVTEFIKGVQSMINEIADKMLDDYSKDGNISKEQLEKIRENMEKIKKEMDDFFAKLLDDDSKTTNSNNRRYSLEEKNIKYSTEAGKGSAKNLDSKTI